MKILSEKFEYCTLDVMFELPEVNSFNALMVIVDKLGELSRLVPCRAGEGQLTAPEVAKLFFKI